MVREDAARFGLTLADDDTLHMEGVSLHEIADKVGTPTYVYSLGAIRSRYRGLRDALGDRPSQICYAVKANSNLAVLKTLAQEGAGADIVSGGELMRATKAGIEPSRIVFSGVGKRDDEIDLAINTGIRSINVESTDELERVKARSTHLGKRAPVSLRLNPDVDPETHPYLATGLRESKFGVSMNVGLELALETAKAQDVELVGLACHIGSQIADAVPFLDSVKRLRQVVDALREAGTELDLLDIGGGLGIAYDDAEPIVDVSAFGKAVRTATEGLARELYLEPGRYLVGNAGVLLSRVIGTKRGEERQFIIVDAAMNDLIRPALYQAYHAVSRSPVPPASEAVHTADLVGPVCECGDFLAEKRSIPTAQRGDLMVVMSAGAYGMVMASTYNTRGLPAEVVVDGDRFAVVRPRQTVEDLIGLDQVPSWM